MRITIFVRLEIVFTRQQCRLQLRKEDEMAKCVWSALSRTMRIKLPSCWKGSARAEGVCNYATMLVPAATTCIGT